ncbi:MAG: amidase [Acidobacteria bacterium]|nr:amidase [Acidobacteriota bacterium]MBU1475045.1 amidase [Acidobacteriota bacterium]MBU2438848.1 amidase [Acidobacteriota bacterium]MBU4330478.1 amidase [Acidobacteriota bacterium]MCG2817106.1 amidase [Candidatus Aminicenantes bacterium]
MTESRKQKGKTSNIAVLLAVSLTLILIFGGAFALYFWKGRAINESDIRSAEKIMGLTFTRKERRMLLDNTRRNLRSYTALRDVDIPNSIPPAFQFNPVVDPEKHPIRETSFSFVPDPAVILPENREEIAAGHYRGPLHGIPWGAKDLLSTKAYPTSWGAMPYRDQIFDEDATVVRRLEEAGAVLVAKLSLGALAMGDVWFGGRTRSPWNPNRGSSGSSAGPGAATAAGLVGFSIGTETHGSIVSPATRNAVSGLRPTFGRVSRHGAMALSWSMDKIGPMCRSAEDCALVFDAIFGPDGRDSTLIDRPFAWEPDRDLKDLRIGYYKKSFEGTFRDKDKAEAVLDYFRGLGVELVPIELPELPVDSMSFILVAEAAASFDELTRSGRDDLLVRQSSSSWPNTFRQARFIPAVEYIQANRLRTLYMRKMAEIMEHIDVYISTNRAGNLLATNLTGHPAVCVPTSVPTEEGDSTAITFIGNLFREADVLLTAKAWQDGTDFHLVHPDLETTLAKKKKDGQ